LRLNDGGMREISSHFTLSYVSAPFPPNVLGCDYRFLVSSSSVCERTTFLDGRDSTACFFHGYFAAPMTLLQYML